MKSPSLKNDLLIRCGIAVGMLLCMLSVGIYLIIRHGLFRELEISITQTAALLSNQVELENGTITFEWKEGLGTNHVLPDDSIFQFWNETSGTTTRSAKLKGLDLPKFSGADGAPEIREIQLPKSERRALAVGVRIYPFVLPDESARMEASGQIIDPKNLPHLLVLARDTAATQRVLNRAGWVLGSGTLLTLAFGFLMIRRVIHLTLRPIDELTAQMKERAEHQLDSALVLPHKLPVELTGLAENFATLLARVAAVRQRERDFIRHASHELRTPIAGLRATTDLALSQPRDAAAYAEHLATCQKTAIELGDLVKRLSALSRLNLAASPLLLKPLDPIETLKDCIETFSPLFHDRGLNLKLDLPNEPLIVSGDETLLKIIFHNLLDNALSYATPETEVWIKGSEGNGFIKIRISNQNNDLPENLERLFEPLFRRDTARNDTHLGIGLTLSLEAASSMAAALEAKKTTDGRIEFTLSIKK